MYEDGELETFFEKNMCQTQGELAITLGLSQQAIAHRRKLFINKEFGFHRI